MSDLPSSLLVPRAPQVNLIPPEVASRKAAGRARGLILIALLLFIALLVAVYYWTSSEQSAAEDELAAAERIGNDLTAEIAEFAEVPLVQAEMANAASARLYVGATEIRWDSLLERMQAVMPADVNIATATFSASSPLAPQSPVEGPFVTPGIGSVSFSGESVAYPDVAELERAINSVAGLTDAQIPSVSRLVTDDGVKYTMAGTATVTVEALDFRFTDAWFAARNREIADEYLDELTSSSAAEVVAARENVDAGNPGAATVLQDALDLQKTVSGAREAFSSLSEVLAIAQVNLEVVTVAQENGEEGADALVAAAQSSVDILAPAMDQLTFAVLATRAASSALDTVSTRVAAAEDLVSAKKAQLETAEAALAAATTDREALQADVDYFEVLVSEAEDVLEAEQSAVSPAEEAFAAAFEALASATTSAETAVTTANVTVALKPSTDAPAPAPAVPTPSPSPTASPSPSATSGSGS